MNKQEKELQEWIQNSNPYSCEDPLHFAWIEGAVAAFTSSASVIDDLELQNKKLWEDNEQLKKQDQATLKRYNQLCEELAQLRQENEQLKGIVKRIYDPIVDKRWFSVTEGLPKEKTLCLVFNSISVEPAVFQSGEFYRYPNEITGDKCALYHFDKTKVTHWMPLPNPPTPIK